MKYRYSFQRELILDTLKRTKTHLTAEEIYKKIKKKLPKISLGTVYRNLGILEDIGTVKKVSISMNKAVYEYSEKPHHHLICTECGTIENVFKPANLRCVNCLSWVKDFKINEALINAFGICKKCQKKSKK